MGSLFGGLLAKSGEKVTLFDIWEEHIEEINKNGLTISKPDGRKETIEKIEATTDPKKVGKTDLAILFVKSYQTEDAMRGASPILNEKIDIMTLQNGLGNPEKMAKFLPEENIIAGVTTHGSTLKGPGNIVHAGEGDTKIGRYFVENDRTVEEVAEVLTGAGIETASAENVKKLIWEKVLVNIGINTPTALARVKNKLIADTEMGNRIVEYLVKEAADVAKRENIDIRDDIVSYVKDVASKTGENKSSMLQDIESGSKTEVENFSGAIIEKAEKHEIRVPLNKICYNLLKLAEEETCK